MSDLAVQTYSFIYYSGFLIFSNPGGSREYEVIRLFMLAFLSIIIIRFVSSFIFDRRLNNRFSRITEESDPALHALYMQAAAKMNIKRPPELFTFSNSKPLVFTSGLLSSSVYLAPHLVKNLEQDELEAVLLHELAHVKRKDTLKTSLFEAFFTGMLAILLQMISLKYICFVEGAISSAVAVILCVALFRSLIWNRLMYLRELFCDDLCVGVIDDPLKLASALVKVYKIGSGLPAFFGNADFAYSRVLFFNNNLEYRLRRLIDYRKSMLRAALKFSARLAAVLSLSFLLTGAFLFHSTFTHIRWDNKGHKNNEYPHFCSDQCRHEAVKRFGRNIE